MKQKIMTNVWLGRAVREQGFTNCEPPPLGRLEKYITEKPLNIFNIYKIFIQFY